MRATGIVRRIDDLGSHTQRNPPDSANQRRHTP